MPLYSYNKQHKNFARNLRRNQTEAEKLLWSKLRARQFLGLKFRRQQPIGGYVLDFYCEESKLAVELDGSQHLEGKQQIYDQIRSAELQELGIKTIRFLDTEILNNIEGVLENISIHVLTSPRPSP